MNRDESVRSAVVSTATGDVQGVVADGVSIFRGIPYGAPTGGANRFRPPQDPAPWTGVRDAVLYGETAPQGRSTLSVGGFEGNRPEIGEDCLVLNVWTPSPDDAKRPVMVWLHGGGFEAGTGSVQLYDGVNVCNRGDVVIVSINHRLGVMGHLHLADIAGDELAGSANAGFLDIVKALEWVRDNISSFGGDPGNVMIYGQSGGGRKVSLATAAPVAAGLFHKGAVQSGSHLLLTPREKAGARAERLLAHLGVSAGDWARLQELPMKDVLRAAREVRGRFSPTIDDVVFDRHVWHPDAPPTAADVPMIIGTNRTELSLQIGLMDPSSYEMTEDELPTRLAAFVEDDDVDPLVELVRTSVPEAPAPEVFFTIATMRGYWRDSVLQTERKAAQAAAGGAPVWSYRIMWRTPAGGGKLISPHNLDLPFVHDNVATAPHIAGAESEETAAMADAMCEAWLAFARTGDPNHPGIPTWRPYDHETRTVMHFDVPAVAVDDPFSAERVAMERYESQQAGGGVLHRLPGEQPRPASPPVPAGHRH